MPAYAALLLSSLIVWQVPPLLLDVLLQTPALGPFALPAVFPAMVPRPLHAQPVGPAPFDSVTPLEATTKIRQVAVVVAVPHCPHPPPVLVLRLSSPLLPQEFSVPPHCLLG